MSRISDKQAVQILRSLQSDDIGDLLRVSDEIGVTLIKRAVNAALAREDNAEGGKPSLSDITASLGYRVPDPAPQPSGPVDKPSCTETIHPEWLWYCETTSGSPLVTFGRWPKTPQQRRYKLAEIQPTEHDHPATSPKGTRHE